MKALLILYLGVILVVTAHAAAIDPTTFKTLQRVEKLLTQKKYQQAEQLLRQRLQQATQPAEKAVLWRALASAHMLQGEYRQASQLLERALASGALPEAQRQEALLSLGQLYLAQDRPRKAALMLERWLRSNPQLRAEDHFLLAQVYTRLERYQQALRHLNRAMALSKQPAKDEWLQLRIGLNYKLKRYRAAIADQKVLIRRHPDKESYWQQLAGLYHLAKLPVTAAAVSELERLLGFLDREPEILNLVSLLRAVHAPLLAGERLQQALRARRVKHTGKNLALLAAAWIEAREYDRAVAALTQAARLSRTGKLWLQLAQLQLERGSWQQAIDALKRALSQGGLKNPGQAWLLLGNAHFELGQWQRAKKAFQQALRYPSTRRSAQQWLNYLAHRNRS